MTEKSSLFICIKSWRKSTDRCRQQCTCRSSMKACATMQSYTLSRRLTASCIHPSSQDSSQCRLLFASISRLIIASISFKEHRTLRINASQLDPLRKQKKSFSLLKKCQSIGARLSSQSRRPKTRRNWPKRTRKTRKHSAVLRKWTIRTYRAKSSVTSSINERQIQSRSATD